MKQNIAQLLKLKARIAGELREATTLCQTFNSQNQAVEQKTPADFFTKKERLQANLISVKMIIASLNRPIMDKLILLPELKGQIEFYKTLNVFQGKKAERDVWSGTRETIETTYVAHISYDVQQAKIKELKVQINNLQDEIDAFNAMTSVEVDDSLVDLD